jgi:hypothetical protein
MRAAVAERFGVWLMPEVVLTGGLRAQLIRDGEGEVVGEPA